MEAAERIGLGIDESELCDRAARNALASNAGAVERLARELYARGALHGDAVTRAAGELQTLPG